MKIGTLHGPTFRFKSGRVVEIQNSDGRCGYLISHFENPNEGNWFSLIDKAFQSAISLDDIESLTTFKTIPVWLNTYNLLEQKGPFFFNHKCDLGSYAAPKPVVWFGWGRSTGTVEICFPDGNKETVRPECSLEDFELQMEGKGYFMKVMWLP